jgi:hypothetical protein
LSTDATNPATASGTVTIFSDAISASQASINSGDHRVHIQGVLGPQGCIPRG